ncbi:MAG: hypothetical protein MMC33_008673 [Icmadophila ericetorum]|nr:hypothetical protein [Icmadophila ericetorum]
MARSVVLVQDIRKRYQWPESQLNFWLFFFFASCATVLGIFAYFITVQNQLQLGTPWIFPYEVTITSLSILFLILMWVLINQRQLLPGIVIVGSFILFVLWLAGLIETAIELFGPTGGVSGNCNLYVNSVPFKGVSVGTLAYLEQMNICQSWEAAFAFEVVGTVFLFWMMIMSWQVNQDEYEN